jgi:hypothetical protein
MRQVFGAVVATAVAGVLAAAPAFAEGAKKEEAKAYCQNNSCKGKSACKAHGNDSCKGKNSCKGHVWLEAKDEAACKAATGVWKKG